MLSDMIDQYVAIKRKRAELAALDRDLSMQAAVLERHLLQSMSEAGTTMAASTTGSIVRRKVDHQPVVVDWPEFYRHIATSSEFDLLQKRLAAPAFRDRWANDVVIPGASAVDIVSLTYSSSRA